MLSTLNLQLSTASTATTGCIASPTKRLSGGSAGVSPAPASDSLAYSYDKVGNRLSLASTLASIQGVVSTFDLNDRLTTDTYDANGNTTVGRLTPSAPQVVDRYDFENRLVNRNNGAVQSVYDGDGNRVRKTVNGVTTLYLVDMVNPTGYAQVLEELTSSNAQPAVVTRVYAYGHALLSQDQFFGSTWTASYYGYDGHGNTRFLSDANGLVTDTYDYDAFGNLIARTGSTPNNYLFTGEQYDSDLGLYYLRARYHNPSTGRFWSMDEFEGFGSDPSSLHKYTYCNNNPVNRVDPSGYRSALTEVLIVGAISGFVAAAVASLSRALGAWSGGADFLSGIDAAFDGIGKDFAEGFAAGFIGGAVGKMAFWAIGKAAPYLFREWPVLMSVLNRVGGLAQKAWTMAEAAWARLEAAIVRGSEAAIRSAEIAFARARTAAVQLGEMFDDLAARVGIRTAGKVLVAPNTVEGYSAQQGFSGAFDFAAGKIRFRPSTSKRGVEVPEGWVPRNGGHAIISQELGGNSAEHVGYTMFLQEDGSLAVQWYSGSLNSAYPGGLVPPSLRTRIMRAIEEATGRRVTSVE